MTGFPYGITSQQQQQALQASQNIGGAYGGRLQREFGQLNQGGFNPAGTTAQERGLTNLGFTQSGQLPLAQVASQVQMWSEEAVAERNQQLGQQAEMRLQSGLGNLSSYRPGGAAAMASPYYLAMANTLLARRTQAPDLLHDYRRNEQFQARRRARNAAELSLAGQLGGAAIGALGSVIGGALGGPAGAPAGGQAAQTSTLPGAIAGGLQGLGQGLGSAAGMSMLGARGIAGPSPSPGAGGSPAASGPPAAVNVSPSGGSQPSQGASPLIQQAGAPTPAGAEAFATGGGFGAAPAQVAPGGGGRKVGPSSPGGGAGGGAGGGSVGGPAGASGGTMRAGGSSTGAPGGVSDGRFDAAWPGGTPLQRAAGAGGMVQAGPGDMTQALAAVPDGAVDDYLQFIDVMDQRLMDMMGEDRLGDAPPDYPQTQPTDTGLVHPSYWRGPARKKKARTLGELRRGQ